MNSTTVTIGAGILGLGVYALYLRRSSNGAQASAASDAKGGSGKGVFSSFGFNSLKLHSTELINHNTKRLRFELPDPNQPSGLALTSALLTVSFPNGGWKPAIRPLYSRQ